MKGQDYWREFLAVHRSDQGMDYHLLATDFKGGDQMSHYDGRQSLYPSWRERSDKVINADEGASCRPATGWLEALSLPTLPQYLVVHCELPSGIVSGGEAVQNRGPCCGTDPAAQVLMVQYLDGLIGHCSNIG